VSGVEPYWQVHLPIAADSGDGRWHGPVPGWLAELRRFRAEMLYADGLRPKYRALDGTYRDDDPCDPFSYQVVGWLDDVPVATMRVVPLAATRAGMCERLLGTSVLEPVLDVIGADRATTCEGSGWAVHAGRRGAAMGMRSLAAGIAVARVLGMRTMVGAVGIRYGALYRALSVGYRRAPGVDPVPVPALVDDVQLIHMTFDDLRPGFRERVEQVAELLRWDGASPTRVNRMTS
jgi:hypothetical protein